MWLRTARSLDPRPEEVLAVNRLFQSARAASEPDDWDNLFRELKACWGPQTVVVGGVPMESHHAHVMIEADHHMKRLCQGLVKVPEMESYLDASLRLMEMAIRKGKPATSRGGGMARFWFHVRDREPKFVAAECIVCVDKCSVVLLTEAQREAADGSLHDSGEDNPLAQEFAREFSAQFSRLAGLHPIYADLEHLFRLYALIRALHLTPGVSELVSVFRGLLESYSLAQSRPMPAGMPGLVNARAQHLEVNRGNETWRHALHTMVCGGVSMDMQANHTAARPRRNRQLDQKRQSIIRDRPHASALWWPLQKAG